MRTAAGRFHVESRRTRGLAREDTADMARGGSRKRRTRHRVPRGRVLLRWLGVGVVVFIAFLYSQPLRSYLSTRDALEERSAEVRSLREQKQRLERRLEAGDTPAALMREARRLGYVKPGERLFIVKGINAWRRAHEQTRR
jgi:cell division protein FtsB